MEPLLAQIIRLLHQAAESRKYADLRMMATRWHDRQQYAEELDANMAAGSVYWFRAKKLIMENAELLEQEIEEFQRKLTSQDPDIDLIRAAQKVITDELNTEAEKALTTTE